MKLFTNKKKLQNEIKNTNNISFVPTMGALHKGHQSLIKVTYLYKPSYSDIYNFKTKNKIFLHPFSKKLCGKFRVNHFYGVVDVVNRFIEIIKPKKIFLGNKDFQQLFLVKKHIQKNGINTKVISCKTIIGYGSPARVSTITNLSTYSFKIFSLRSSIMFSSKN